MVARTRSLRGEPFTGQIRNNLTGAIQNRTGYRRFDTNSDHIRAGLNNTLRIRHVVQEGGLVNWANPNTFSSSWFNAPMSQLQDAGGGFYNDQIWKGIPGEPTSLGALATQLLAETNPSRPVVDIPTYLVELRDFPRLLRWEGNTLIRRAGSANLSYHFGWRPLLSDLSSLLDFQDIVATRYRELKAFYDSGLRRKRLLWSGASPATHSGTYNSGDGFNYTGTHQLAQTARTWGSVEWYPTTLPPRTEEALRSLARRAALGLTVDLSTFWNLMPWSWLIDWCSNVGDFLIARRNIVPAEPRNILIMRYRKVNGIHEPTDGRVSRHSFDVEWKYRDQATPTLSAHLPVLSARQLSILGSIGVTRRVPRSSLG
nr:MAG: hypothetical protein 1 [Leviviridae sp.]